jgi:hypothetical protein
MRANSTWCECLVLSIALTVAARADGAAETTSRGQDHLQAALRAFNGKDLAAAEAEISA